MLRSLPNASFGTAIIRIGRRMQHIGMAGEEAG